MVRGGSANHIIVSHKTCKATFWVKSGRKVSYSWEIKIKERCARLEHTLNKDQRRWITGERCEVLGKLFSKYLVGSGELFTFAAENILSNFKTECV